MSNKTLSKVREIIPSVFDDFFKPWNELFNGDRVFQSPMTVPAVNVTEEKDGYHVTLAAPGLEKDDFKVDVDDKILTISAEKEESKEEKDKTYSRKEYNYSSFSRSFTLPDEVIKNKITATYSNGQLILTLPKTEKATSQEKQQIKIS